tara:strand:+ start:2117 stop:3322 length:1206 start_codon:yes stop_codon:yes gene_type:complete
MNLFFFIYQQIEFNNYFSVATELKKKNKEINIFFVFTNKEKFKLITKNKLFSAFLKKNFKLIILKSSNKLLIQRANTLLNLIILLKRIFSYKNKKMFLFPSIKKRDNKLIFYALKFLKINVSFLSPDKFVQKSSMMPEFQWKTKLDFTQKDVDNYNKLFFYHAENRIYKTIKKLSNKNSKKLATIGLPDKYENWVKYINQCAQKVQSKLKRKFKNYSSIYTIVGGKDLDYRMLSNKNSQFNSLNKIVRFLFKFDQKCIILFKKHPRNLSPEYLKKFRKEFNSNRFISTTTSLDILSKVSKRFFYLSPTASLTEITDTKKIDCSDIKKNNLERYKKKILGYNVIHFSFEGKNMYKNLKKITHDDSFFNKKKIFFKERDLIKKNPPLTEKLLENLNYENKKQD